MITIEDVLRRTTQEEIFKLVFEKVDFSVYYKNPCRVDNSADCFFHKYGDKIYFVDFANEQTHWDCFNIICSYFNYTLPQAIDFIITNLEIDFSYEAPIVFFENTRKNKPKEKKKTIIETTKKPFDIFHHKYWSRYEIKKDELIEDEIFAVKKFNFFSHKHNKKFYVQPLPNQVTYAIGEFKDSIKICNTYKKGKGKWITNCTANNIGGINKLLFSGKTIIITKSYKDCRVLRNQGLNAIWFQNEGMIPNITLLKELLYSWENIIIWFDNDKAGIKAAEKLKIILNKIHPRVFSIRLPNITNIKDPSDCIFNDKKLFNKFINNIKNGKVFE